MKKINLVTQNLNKVNEFKRVLEPEFSVVHLNFDYPELRSDDPIEIVEIAAKSLAEKLGKMIVVEDSGFFIDALEGFPGTCTAYSHKRIGNDGFVRLMKEENNRKCFYKSAIGICSPGEDPHSFLGVEEGKVALKAVGEKGWGQDAIFIPKGSRKTYGEIRSNEDVNAFREDSVLKLKKFLMN